MIGVILAGGLGTRLHPLTLYTNKHMIRVGALPMIEYPIYTLVEAGIKDIAVVSGGEFFEQIEQYLSHGNERGLNFHYENQNRAGEKPKGIAHALGRVRQIVGKEDMAVILGDNIFGGRLDFKLKEGIEGRIFLKKVPDPQRFGVAELKDRKVISIEEKPKKPKSSYAVTGAYVYKANVFDFIESLEPSARGEMEITDVNNWYVQRGKMDCNIMGGFWSDAGTRESIKKAEHYVEKGLEKKILANYPFLDEREEWNKLFL